MEIQPAKAAHKSPRGEASLSEKKALAAVRTTLSRRQTERGGKAFWNAEQMDRHQARCGEAYVACEPLWKVETIMRPLRTRQRNWCECRLTSFLARLYHIKCPRLA
jgi:hypothetical protein